MDNNHKVRLLLMIQLIWFLTLQTSTTAIQISIPKEPEALTVRHLPNPSEGYLWRRPDKWIGYKWPYRTEVRNNLDVPLQITHFGFYCYENGKWVLENLSGTLFTDADFSNWYTDGDSMADGWIPPGKVAVHAENWNTWWPPAPPPCKWTYTAQDPAGNVYHAEGQVGLTPVFYRYHAGDDTAWAMLEFDDSDWEIADTEPLPKNWPGLGWFRLHLAVDSTLFYQPLALSMRQSGAAEIYLDGRLLYKFGKVGASRTDEQVYWERNPQSISFNNQTDHLIAVRYSNFSINHLARYGLPTGFFLRLGDMNTLIASRASEIRSASINQMLIAVVLLAFAVLHLSLFLFYPRGRSHLYFAVFCVAFAVQFFVEGQWTTFLTNTRQAMLLVLSHSVASLLAVVAGMRFLYSLFYKKLPKPFWLFLVGAIGLGLGSWFQLGDVDIGYWLMVLAVSAEIFRVILVAIIKKKEGAWILGIGFMILGLVSTYHMLVNLELLPFEARLGFIMPYGVCAMALSMSLYLSRSFAQTNQALEKKLIEVKALSEMAIQQEREKAHLEAENARKTKELEEARQLQLSMLPKTVPELPNLEIAAYSKPATEVGGDYYDFHLDKNGTLTIAIGDATGHGMSAGTMVSISKGLFKSLVKEDSLVKILKEMSRSLASMQLGYLYMAMTLVRFNKNEIRITAAGMPPAIIYHTATKKVEEIVLKGLPLGGFPDFPYKEAKISLPPNDTLVLMSDGLPERFNDAGEILDYGTIPKLIKKAGNQPPQAIIDYLVEAGEKWSNGRPQDDDVTFVVMKVK